jgi:putative transposase
MVNEIYPNVSHAKTCKLLNCSRTKKYYQKKMPIKDVKTREAIESVLGTWRMGRKKVIYQVRKKHPEMGASKIRRVYENEGFSLWKRLKKRRFNNPANPIEVPLKANVEWAMDFMTDVLTNGNKFRTLNIVDQYNRKCLCIEIKPSLPSWRVINALEQTIEKYGKPKGIRTDNGPEFTSNRFQNWMEKNAIRWVKIQKGKPQQNAIIERFNRTYREDILDANIFKTMAQVNDLTETWRLQYNQERPHQSLNYQTPNEYAA